MRHGGNLRGALVALLSMGIYATHDAIIKTLGAVYPALQILFFSSLLSFPFIAALLLRDPTHGTLRPKNPLWVSIRAAAIVGSGMCGFYAFSVLPMAQVYAILFASPLLITVLSIPFLGEKVGRHRWAAVLAGLVGVMIVLRPGQTALEFGHLAALGGASCTAMAAISVRKLSKSERTVILILWPMLGNFLLTGASLTLDYRPMELQHLAMAGAIAVLGMLGSFLLILAYQAGEAAVVAPMQYSQMLWATAFGWFLFDERLQLSTAIGSVFIIGSGLYILMREHKTAPEQPGYKLRLRSDTVTAPRPTLLRRLWGGKG